MKCAQVGPSAAGPTAWGHAVLWQWVMALPLGGCTWIAVGSWFVGGSDAAWWPTLEKVEEGRMVYRTVRFAFAALVLALAGLHPPSANAADAKALLESMEATPPDWLPSLDKCPADVMPARETESGFYEGRCESTLDQCLRTCQDGNASDCYASAVALQKVRNSSVSEALFLRACALGVASGCTNRAARMVSENDADPCAIRTFAAACDRLDPWACTMIGFHLVRGIGIGKDHKRARQVLSRSCRYGEADEACRSAKSLMKEIHD